MASLLAMVCLQWLDLGELRRFVAQNFHLQSRMASLLATICLQWPHSAELRRFVDHNFHLQSLE
eukprot:c15221_g1_i1 orf=61-252(+)